MRIRIKIRVRSAHPVRKVRVDREDPREMLALRVPKGIAVHKGRGVLSEVQVRKDREVLWVKQVQRVRRDREGLQVRQVL